MVNSSSEQKAWADVDVNSRWGDAWAWGKAEDEARLLFYPIT